MKISLITPTYNSASTIRDTLESVAGQTYRDLEYIIIDGVSQDDTLSIIQEYQDRLNFKLLSEPDNGLYEAMNKGINLATGEIVGILNSDDFFKDNLALEKVAGCLVANPEAEACYSDLEFVDPNNLARVVRFWRAGIYHEKKLANGWIIPHPSLFIKNVFYKNHPQWFNEQFRLAADYEMILRFLKVYQMKVVYLPETLVRMRVGGASSRNLKQRRLGWRELCQAWKINNLKKPLFFIGRRVISKLPQFFRGIHHRI